MREDAAFLGDDSWNVPSELLYHFLRGQRVLIYKTTALLSYMPSG